jgi:hypothetical protein
MRCCARDRGVWPPSVGPRGQALNHPELRWLKTVVVSVREKAWHDCVRWGSGRRARTSSGVWAMSLLKRRDNHRWRRNRGSLMSSRDKPGGDPFAGQVAPGVQAA